MARPRSISDETLLDAAREVFLRDGYGAATTAIAKSAGVSEATLFKRFGTKDELFFRALCDCPGAMAGLALGPLLAGKEGAAERLETVLTHLIEHFRVEMPRMILLMSHGGFNPVEFWQRNPNAAPLKGLKALTAFIDGEMRHGRLSQADPEVVARMLAGSARSFVFFELIGMQESMPMASTTYARGAIDVLLRGIAPVRHQDASPRVSAPSRVSAQ
ncbi:MAG: AcrR family transcriptional regulator [Myxococcota bacterium]|jgi:AcrR family transcriptional regulator